MGNNSEVDKILNCLNEKASKPAAANAKIVNQFVDGLKDILKNEKGVLKNSDIMHCGSSYEALVVKAKSDFDIPLILSDPFTGSKFKIIRDAKTQFFQLQWTDNPPKDCDKYCDKKILNAKELQKDIFGRIHELSKQIHLSGWTVGAKDGLTAVDITLQSGDKIISIDLAPQIPVRTWCGCPDLLPVSSLPNKLGEHINNLEKNSSPIFFFSPAVPNSAIMAANKDGHVTSFSTGYDDQCTSNGHQLLNISFSILEKNFLKMDSDVRDMVRLVKLVVHLKEWRKKYGIKSFHIKRVAINHYQDLQKESTKWSGFKKLMEFLKEDIVNEKNIGCFMKNQCIDKLKETEDLKKEMDIAYRMKPEELYKLV